MWGSITYIRLSLATGLRTEAIKNSNYPYHYPLLSASSNMIKLVVIIAITGNQVYVILFIIVTERRLLNSCLYTLKKPISNQYLIGLFCRKRIPEG